MSNVCGLAGEAGEVDRKLDGLAAWARPEADVDRAEPGEGLARMVCVVGMSTGGRLVPLWVRCRIDWRLPSPAALLEPEEFGDVVFVPLGAVVPSPPDPAAEPSWTAPFGSVLGKDLLEVAVEGRGWVE